MTSIATDSQDSAPRYAPEDLTLPKPWRGLVAGSMGYLYYWNPVTNVTQYERPAAENQLPPPPPLPKSAPLSSVQVNQHHREEDGRSRNLQQQVGRVSSARLTLSSDVRHVSSGVHSRPSGVHNVNGSALSKTSMRNLAPSNARVYLSSEAYCRQHEITVTGEDIPAPYMTFESTGFPAEVLKEVHHAGFSFPTPIQAQSWPIALQNRDLVAIAKTGSGKTIGYLFPGFAHIKRLHNNSKIGPTVLVLSPTRELATQIQDEAEKFGRSSNISCTCLYGGAPKSSQLRDLERGVDIVVATPGRLNDILEMRRISLWQVSYLVLDEADRMLDMGFEPQIRKIVKEVPHLRQTLMFTATWPKEVRKIAADLLVNPVQVNIGNIDELVANKAITQHVELIKPMEKQRRLEQILRSQETGSKVLIFCTTKRMCDQLARSLVRQFGVACIHGDKSQVERDRVLGQFKTGRSPILVATDVAARGLDIKDIRAVINYDFPTGVEDYVHRIGRTGRAGATGISYTFFSDHDSKYALELIKVLEGADQQVPLELRDMAARGGYGGKSRRWGSGTVARDTGRFWADRNDSNNVGRSGHLAPSTRVDRSSRNLGHDRDNSNGDNSNRYRCANGQALEKLVNNDTRYTLRGRSHSPSPSPRRGHDVRRNDQNHGRSMGWDKTHNSRSRSRSCSLGCSNGRSLEMFAPSNQRSPPFKRKVNFDGERSSPHKRRDSSKDCHRGPSPHLRREISNDRLRGSPIKREIPCDDRHYNPSPALKSEKLINRSRRLSPSRSSRDIWKPVIHDHMPSFPQLVNETEFDWPIHDHMPSFPQLVNETESDRPIHKCQSDGIESGKITNGPAQLAFAPKDAEEEEGLIPLDEDEGLIPPELVAAS